MIQKFLDALDDGIEYDFIANNYYKMRKEDLKSILLEYMYAVHSTPSVSDNFSADVADAVRESLVEKEVFGDEENS